MDAIKPSINAAQTYQLISTLDLYQNAIFKNLVRVVPKASSLSWLKYLKGYMGTRTTDRHEYSFYQEGQFMRGKAQIANIAANGAMFDITLSAGDHYSVTGANKDSFVVRDMQVVFTDGKTTGFVYTLDKTVAGAHVVTVKKTDSSQDIATVATIGSWMIFFSNAQSESSKKTSPRVEQYTKITNKMQIIREYFEVTDVEMQNKTWFEVDGHPYLWYHGMDSTRERFELQTDLALLISNESSGLTNLDAKNVQTLNGMFPQIRTGGKTLEYLGKPDKAAFDEVKLSQDAQYAGNKFFVGQGHNMETANTDFLVEFGKAGTGNISFSPFNGGREQAISLNFAAYMVGNYEYYFQKWDVLSHEDTLGAEGMPYRHYGVFIPAGMTRDTNPQRSKGSPAYVPYIMMVTPPLSTLDANPSIVKDDHLMWEDGALSRQGPTNDELKKGIHMARYVSLEMRCRNQWLLWERADA